jgi:hypothetical protein
METDPAVPNQILSVRAEKHGNASMIQVRMSP